MINTSDFYEIENIVKAFNEKGCIKMLSKPSCL